MKVRGKRLTALAAALFLGLNYLPASGSAANKDQIVSSGGTAGTLSDGITLSKTIEETDLENIFDITLKVTTTDTIEEIEMVQPKDVVLVVDVSASMDTGFDGNPKSEENPSKLEAAINAANTFIDEFQENASHIKGRNRIGLVVFNSDATGIFDLMTCVTEEEADLLKKQTTEGLRESCALYPERTRFTNIEAGLRYARYMLESSNTEDKYIVLLSDGFPTTYCIDDMSTEGWDTYMDSENTTGHTSDWDKHIGEDGYFWNQKTSVICGSGTSYSDRAAEKAKKEAAQIKEEGITVYSVGIALDSQEIPYYEMVDIELPEISIIDTYEDDSYVVSDIKKFLEDDIASHNYIDSNDQEALKSALKNIFDSIRKKTLETVSKAFVVVDPVGKKEERGEYVDFVDFCDDNKKESYDADYPDTDFHNEVRYESENHAIWWDLKESSYVYDEENRAYSYEVKYRVRLLNEKEGFSEYANYDTNENATLSYVTKSADGILNVDTMNFPTPSVIGFLGTLTFIKTDENGTPKKDVTFVLSHDERCDKCAGNGTPVFINSMKRTSNPDGIVTFDNIPSGHDYILSEDPVPGGYKIDDKRYISVRLEEGKKKACITEKDYDGNILSENDNFSNIVNRHISLWVANNTPGDLGGFVEINGFPESKSRISSDGNNDNTKGRYDKDTATATPDEGYEVCLSDIFVNYEKVSLDDESRFSLTDKNDSYIEGQICENDDKSVSVVITNYEKLHTDVDVLIAFTRKEPETTSAQVPTTTPEETTSGGVIPPQKETTPSEIETTTVIEQEPTTTQPETSRKEVPTTKPPETSKKEVPTTIQPETSKKEVPTTTQPETSRKEAPTTKPPETSKKEVPTTTQPETSRKEVPTTTQPETSRKEVPTTKPAKPPSLPPEKGTTDEEPGTTYMHEATTTSAIVTSSASANKTTESGSKSSIPYFPPEHGTSSSERETSIEERATTGTSSKTKESTTVVTQSTRASYQIETDVPSADTGQQRTWLVKVLIESVCGLCALLLVISGIIRKKTK